MLKVEFSGVEELEQALREFQGNAEDAINDVLHNYAGDRAQVDIVRLMPVSKKKKGTHAKFSNSLKNIPGNLSVTVTTNGKYGYLYFPDDGTNTRRHVGNQRFFERGGEAATDDIIERCVAKLTQNFE